MNVKEFRKICKYASIGGLINECYIAGNIAISVNIEKTAMAMIHQNINISQPIFINNINNIITEISEYGEDQEISIIDNRFCINVDNVNKYSTPLSILNEPKQLAKLPDESYYIIAKGIDHNIINSIGNSIKKSMESSYTFEVVNDDLCIRIGENISSTKSKLIGKVQKCTENISLKFKMDIPECCKNLMHVVDIYLLKNSYILMECNISESDIYKIQYFIAALKNETN